MSTYDNLDDLFNETGNSADTDLFSSDISPAAPGIMRIEAALDSSSILKVAEKDGVTTEVYDLNDGNALTAGAAHTFTLSVNQGFDYNFRLGTGVDIQRLFVDIDRRITV